MKKKVVIGRNVHKDFYQEMKKYTCDEIDSLQFIKDNAYDRMLEEIYNHHFASLSDDSTIKYYVEAGAGIYRDMDRLNKKLHIAYGGNLDEYLLYLIAGQFLDYFDESEVLSYETGDTLVAKFKTELQKVSTEPFTFKEGKEPYILLNNLIEQKGICHNDLLKNSGLSHEVLSALRSGRKKCTKDIYYIIALAMNLSKREFKKFAGLIPMDLDTDRDNLILSHMNNLLQLGNMPENSGKTSVEIINYLLKENDMKPLSDAGKIKPKSPTQRTIFITGGMGFIGKNCIEFFKQKSKSKDDPFQYHICVSSTSNISNEDIPSDVIYYKGKLDNQLLYERILLENDVDYIIHLAAIPIPKNAKKNPGKTFDVNAQGFNTLCSTILQNNIPVKGIIFPSTEHVYTGDAGECREDAVIDDTKIKTTYAYSKYIAENIGRSYAQEGLKVVITRLGNIYGEYDKHHLKERLIPKTIHYLQEGKQPELYVDAKSKESAKLDLLYVKDLACAFYMIFRYLDLPEHTYDKNDITFNLGSGRGYCVEEIQKLIMQILGKEVPAKVIPAEIRERAVMDVEKIRQKFGFVAKTDLEEGLRKTTAWYLGLDK